MSVGVRLALLALGVPLLAGGPFDAGPTTLNVFAAASLTEAFRDLGRVLETQHAGLAVRFNFAGSPQLALQIEQGAPADVFASADRRWMDEVRHKGEVEGDAPIFARNRLVVIVPRTNPARIKALPDLVRRGTKIVIAAEAVPAGKYSREALQKLASAKGYPERYDRRVLANVVSQEENVKSVVSKIQLGEADAGFVYRSDVTAAVARYVTVIDIPDRSNVLAEYPIAVLKSAPNAEAAQMFVALVRSEDGQRVLQQHGLISATTPPPANHP
jgi:molybdate transport system substrate-binding protein